MQARNKEWTLVKTCREQPKPAPYLRLNRLWNFGEKIDNVIRELKTLHPNLKTLHPNFENVISKLWKRYIRTLKRYIPTKVRVELSAKKLNKWTEKVEPFSELKKTRHCNSWALFPKGEGADQKQNAR